MLAKVLTGAVVGLEGHPPEAGCPERGRRACPEPAEGVEVDIDPGLPAFNVVRLPDAAMQSREFAARGIDELVLDFRLRFDEYERVLELVAERVLPAFH